MRSGKERLSTTPGAESRSTTTRTSWIVNVQNENSHTIQFDNTNAAAFSVAESRKYYDTTELKRQGR